MYTTVGYMQKLLPYFLKHKIIWASYGNEAGVLYHTDNSEMTEDEVIIRYENEKIVGLTILNASQRVETNSANS